MWRELLWKFLFEIIWWSWLLFFVAGLARGVGKFKGPKIFGGFLHHLQLKRIEFILSEEIMKCEPEKIEPLEIF